MLIIQTSTFSFSLWLSLSLTLIGLSFLYQLNSRAPCDQKQRWSLWTHTEWVQHAWQYFVSGSILMVAGLCACSATSGIRVDTDKAVCHTPLIFLLLFLHTSQSWTEIQNSSSKHLCSTENPATQRWQSDTSDYKYPPFETTTLNLSGFKVSAAHLETAYVKEDEPSENDSCANIPPCGPPRPLTTTTNNAIAKCSS
jgi:hypothetical protein